MTELISLIISAVSVKIVQIFCTNDKETIFLELIFMIEYFIFKLACSNSADSEESVEMKRTTEDLYSRSEDYVKARLRRKSPAYWNKCHGVRLSDFHYLPYYRLAAPYLKVSTMGGKAAVT